MSNPVGFWSYARSDDTHSDGHLSQLRTIVGKAIALQHGADIQIWQDIQAIPPGANWSVHIERTISQTVFFIPILTPRYLKSKHCLAELQSFRKRMNELGRDDIIFPIQYVSVGNVDREDSVFGEEFDELHRHQWSDFRPLRHADPSSHEVWTWVDKLAEHILQVAVPVSKAEDALLAARKREPGPDAAELARARKSAEKARETERLRVLAEGAEDARRQEEARAADAARLRQAAADAAEAAEQTISTPSFMPQTAVVALDPGSAALFETRARTSHAGKPHTALLVAMAAGLVALSAATWFGFTRQQAAPPMSVGPSPAPAPAPAPEPVKPQIAPALPVPVPAPVVATPPVVTPAPPAVSPPAEASANGAAPARPPDLQGSVDKMLDSTALIVSGRIVNLSGVRGVDGRPAKAMQHYLESEGNVLQCYARDEAYQCFANGRDIATHALRAGWARARPGGPSQYAAAEQDARGARSGIWGK